MSAADAMAAPITAMIKKSTDRGDPGTMDSRSMTWRALIVRKASRKSSQSWWLGKLSNSSGLWPRFCPRSDPAFLKRGASTELGSGLSLLFVSLVAEFGLPRLLPHMA